MKDKSSLNENDNVKQLEEWSLSEESEEIGVNIGNPQMVKNTERKQGVQKCVSGYEGFFDTITGQHQPSLAAKPKEEKNGHRSKGKPLKNTVTEVIQKKHHGQMEGASWNSK